MTQGQQWLAFWCHYGVRVESKQTPRLSERANHIPLVMRVDWTKSSNTVGNQMEAAMQRFKYDSYRQEEWQRIPFQVEGEKPMKLSAAMMMRNGPQRTEQQTVGE